MGFMDSVSTFTKGVGAKAKGNYDVVALNTQISACKREILALYSKLGETYYATHKNDPDDSVKGIVSDIIERENKIAVINDQIAQTKEATAAVQLTNSPVVAGATNSLGRKCANCGATLADDAVFCAECGTKNEIVEALKCSNCGAVLEADAMFCSVCGTKVE